MTVGEYLRVINLVPEGVELSGETIQITGLLDIVPYASDTYKGLKVLGLRAAEFSVFNGFFIAKRVCKTEAGEFPIDSVVSLNDDIALHCGSKFSTSESVIYHTIEGLKEIQASENRIQAVLGGTPKNYQPAIEHFEKVLEKIRKDNEEQPGDSLNV